MKIDDYYKYIFGITGRQLLNRGCNKGSKYLIIKIYTKIHYFLLRYLFTTQILTLNKD